jgi:hypothetical protein
LARLRERRYQAIAAHLSRCSHRGAGEISMTNAFSVKDFGWCIASSAALGDDT